MIIIPNHTAKRPAKILTITYKKDEKISPLVPNVNVSNENVENVVNPPQKPTTRRAFRRGFPTPFLLRIPNKRPIKRHPITLIVKVAKGKEVFHKFTNSLLIKKRQQVPTNPPAPDKSISFHIKQRNRISNLQKKADIIAGMDFVWVSAAIYIASENNIFL